MPGPYEGSLRKRCILRIVRNPLSTFSRATDSLTTTHPFSSDDRCRNLPPLLWITFTMLVARAAFPIRSSLWYASPCSSISFARWRFQSWKGRPLPRRTSAGEGYWIRSQRSWTCEELINPPSIDLRCAIYCSIQGRRNLPSASIGRISAGIPNEARTYWHSVWDPTKMNRTC